MRYALFTGLLIGAAAILYSMRDTPMVRQRAEQAKRTATEVGGVVSNAASDIRETATHAAHDQRAQAA